MERTDQNLIAAYLQGDETALEILVGRYIRPLYFFIYYFVKEQAVAEELVQETWLKAWQHLRQYKADKKFSTWLYAIAKNTALDYLRRKKAINFSDLDQEGLAFVDTVVDEEFNLDEQIDQVLLQDKIKLSIEQLPVPQRLVVLMHYRDDLTFESIAAMLGESINTVKSRYQRALLTLRRLF